MCHRTSLQQLKMFSHSCEFNFMKHSLQCARERVRCLNELQLGKKINGVLVPAPTIRFPMPVHNFSSRYSSKNHRCFYSGYKKMQKKSKKQRILFSLQAKEKGTNQEINKTSRRWSWQTQGRGSFVSNEANEGSPK